MIAIRGMEMPQKCTECPCFDRDYGCRAGFVESCNISIERSRDCPLSDTNDMSPTDVIPIPEGATNGDMIKALFPDIVAETVKLDGEIIGYDICNMDIGTYAETYFTESWWNAPYKKEVEE